MALEWSVKWLAIFASPLRSKLRAMIAQGNDLANAPPRKKSCNPGRRPGEKTALTAQFQADFNASFLLTQEIVLLGEIQVNLRQWEALYTGLPPHPRIGPNSVFRSF